jgi:hypothetical protein
MNIQVNAREPKRISKFIYGLFDFNAGKDSLTDCVNGIVTSFFDLDELGVSLDDLSIELTAFNNIILPEPEQLTSGQD